MNENMRFNTFKHLNFPNILSFDLQQSFNSAGSSSTEFFEDDDNSNVSITSSESNNLSEMEQVNHLSYIDSESSELIFNEKADDFKNYQIGSLLYKPNTDIKNNIFTINDEKIDFGFERTDEKLDVPVLKLDQVDSLSGGNNISKFAIDSVTMYKKTNDNPSPIKSATTILTESENFSIKKSPSESFIAKDEQNMLSSESAYDNKIETIKMYRDTAAKTKDPGLMFDFAVFLLKSGLEIYDNDIKTSKKIIKEGCYYLKKMAIKGNVEAQYLLGDVYSNDTMKCQNLKQSRILFETAAKKSHPQSAYRTALCYEEGIGVSRNSRKALTFFKFAASRNHTLSMYKIGMFYFKGQMGVSKSIVTQQNGINWLSRAVAKGDADSAEAAYELAKIYEKGFLDIIIPDINYAVLLYVHASSLGHTKSNTKLGQIYEKTENKLIKQNKMLSIHYYTIASNSTNPDSNAQLKLSFFNLLGVNGLMEPDLALAFAWAEKAAKLENADAEYTLGYYYEKGIGCDKNMDKANEWFKLAFQHGNLKALKKLKYEDASIGMNDSMVSLVSDVISEKNFSRELVLKKNKITSFLKRKKNEFEKRFESTEDLTNADRWSTGSPSSKVTDIKSEFYSTALPYIETGVIPQLIKTIEHQNEKTFLHSKRLRRIFKPL